MFSLSCKIQFARIYSIVKTVTLISSIMVSALSGNKLFLAASTDKQCGCTEHVQYTWHPAQTFRCQCKLCLHQAWVVEQVPSQVKSSRAEHESSAYTIHCTVHANNGNLLSWDAIYSLGTNLQMYASYCTTKNHKWSIKDFNFFFAAARKHPTSLNKAKEQREERFIEWRFVTQDHALSTIDAIAITSDATVYNIHSRLDLFLWSTYCTLAYL